jgi:hypothetical protein
MSEHRHHYHRLEILNFHPLFTAAEGFGSRDNETSKNSSTVLRELANFCLWTQPANHK